MKRQLIFATMLSGVFAVALAAQQPASPQTPPAQPPPAAPAEPRPQSGDRAQADRSGQTVTFTGCVAAAGSKGAGAAGAAAGAPAGQPSAGYILTNATAAGSAGTTGRTPGAGSPATGAPSGAAGTTATSYRLMSGQDQDLSKYVGQRVEITGTLGGDAGRPGAAGSANPPAAGSPGASPSASGAQGQGTMPGLRVTSVRPATGGGTCTQ